MSSFWPKRAESISSSGTHRPSIIPKMPELQKRFLFPIKKNRQKAGASSKTTEKAVQAEGVCAILEAAERQASLEATQNRLLPQNP